MPIIVEPAPSHPFYSLKFLKLSGAKKDLAKLWYGAHYLELFFKSVHLRSILTKEMAGRRREENLESKIIIRNYPPDTDDRDLRIMFEKYGKIEDCE